MTELHDDSLMVCLAVDDARTAQDAGTKFARDLAGAVSVDFMLALGEQDSLIRRAIMDAGFSDKQAHLAAEHFEAAAREEWARLASAMASDVSGTA